MVYQFYSQLVTATRTAVNGHLYKKTGTSLQVVASIYTQQKAKTQFTCIHRPDTFKTLFLNDSRSVSVRH
jgi:hypothetical protein